MNEPQPVGPIAELAANRLMMGALRRELADLQREFCRQNREAYDSGFESGLHRGRRAALGWLFVGAASGFIAAFAVGFAIFW